MIFSNILGRGGGILLNELSQEENAVLIMVEKNVYFIINNTEHK